MKHLLIMMMVAVTGVILSGCRSLGNGEEPSLTNFIGHLVAVHPVSEGTLVRFTGNFLKIPTQLEAELRQKFPEMRFAVAQMEFLHWGWESVNLIMMVDAKTGHPETYLWDIWFTDPPFSFSSVFTPRLGKRSELQGTMTCLGNLIAFSMSGSIGQVVETAEHMELVIKDRDGKPWRIMSVATKSQMTSKGLTFVNPSTREQKANPPAGTER